MNKNYWILLQGQFISTLGSGVFFLVMILYGQEVTDSASIIGIALMMSQLPGAIIGPFISGLIDKKSKKKLLIICDLLSAACMFIFLFSFFLIKDTLMIINLMIITAMLIGILNSILRPTIFSIANELAGPKKVQQSNSFLQSSFQGAGIIANSLGGILYAMIGPMYLTMINGISYFLSAISETFIKEEKNKNYDIINNNKDEGVLKASAEGIRYIWRHKGLRSFIMVSFLINLSISPLAILLPFHIKNSLHLGAEEIGFALAGEGAGLLVGFLISSKLVFKNLFNSLVYLFLICAILIFTLGQLSSILSLVLCCGILGILIGLINVPLITILQKIPPQHMIGRVISVFINAITAITPIGMGLSGLAIDYLNGNTEVLFMLCSILLIFSSLLMYMNLDVKNMIDSQERAAN